jgi:hypothetical protein
MRTAGNPDGYLILRGGKSGPNFDRLHVDEAARAMVKAKLNPAIIVDCSHGNSEKRFERQALVLRDVLAQRQEPGSPLVGLMLESNLEEGCQAPTPSGEGLRYGVSITDPCIGWKDTAELLGELLESDRPFFTGGPPWMRSLFSPTGAVPAIRPRRVGLCGRFGRNRSGALGRRAADHEQPHGIVRGHRRLGIRLSEPGFASRAVTVYTDSQYVQKGITSWISSWKRNGWRTASKEPVKNKELWQALGALAARFTGRLALGQGTCGNAYTSDATPSPRKPSPLSDPERVRRSQSERLTQQFRQRYSLILRQRHPLPHLLMIRGPVRTSNLGARPFQALGSTLSSIRSFPRTGFQKFLTISNWISTLIDLHQE